MKFMRSCSEGSHTLERAMYLHLEISHELTNLGFHLAFTAKRCSSTLSLSSLYKIVVIWSTRVWLTSLLYKKSEGLPFWFLALRREFACKITSCDRRASETWLRGKALCNSCHRQLYTESEFVAVIHWQCISHDSTISQRASCKDRCPLLWSGWSLIGSHSPVILHDSLHRTSLSST